jgi:hypothetical protein
MALDTERNDDPRSTRLALIHTESGIKSIGQLCYLVTVLCGLGTLEGLLVAMGVLDHPHELDETLSPEITKLLYWVFSGIMLLLTLGHWVLAHGLSRLQNWARWTVVALTGCSLLSSLGFGVGLCLAYPAWGLLSLLIGGVLHAMILYPLLTPGASEVFSAGYKEVIRVTPQIRSRMHWLLKLLIGLIVLGVVGLLGYLLAIYLRIIDT